MEFFHLEKNSDFNFFFKNKNELNITDKNKVEEFINLNKINCIINCAAYTNVESSEIERHKAYITNADAVKYLSQFSLKKNIKLIHI